jgi:hypothetical protein
LALLALFAESQECQTMILAALLVEMTNPRCQKHQERPESVFRHPDPAILEAFTRLWTMVAECRFARPRSWRNLPTAARGMSFLMQSTILEAVTTRLVSQKAPADKQRHCDCAHKHKPLVARWMCQSTQHISD